MDEAQAVRGVRIALHNHFRQNHTHDRERLLRDTKATIDHALKHSIDILCITGWNNNPDPYAFHDAVVHGLPKDGYKVKQHRTVIAATKSGKTVILPYCLESKMILLEQEGEIITIGIDPGLFPKKEGNPKKRYKLTKPEKRQLGKEYIEYIKGQHPLMLSYVPHPGYRAGFDTNPTALLIKQQIVDCFAMRNLAVEEEYRLLGAFRAVMKHIPPSKKTESIPPMIYCYPHVGGEARWVIETDGIRPEDISKSYMKVSIPKHLEAVEEIAQAAFDKLKTMENPDVHTEPLGFFGFFAKARYSCRNPFAI